MVTWEDKWHHSESPLFLILPPTHIDEHDYHIVQISILTFGINCPSCVPSQLLVNFQPPWWDGVRSRKSFSALRLCNPCSTIAKTFMCYRHCFSHKSKTQQDTHFYEEYYPRQNQCTQLCEFWVKSQSLSQLSLSARNQWQSSQTFVKYRGDDHLAKSFSHLENRMLGSQFCPPLDEDRLRS